MNQLLNSLGLTFDSAYLGLAATQRPAPVLLHQEFRISVGTEFLRVMCCNPLRNQGLHLCIKANFSQWVFTYPHSGLWIIINLNIPTCPLLRSRFSLVIGFLPGLASLRISRCAREGCFAVRRQKPGWEWRGLSGDYRPINWSPERKCWDEKRD